VRQHDVARPAGRPATRTSSKSSAPSLCRCRGRPRRRRRHGSPSTRRPLGAARSSGLGAQIGRRDEVLLGRDRGADLDHQVRSLRSRHRPSTARRLVEQRASAAASVPTSCSHGVGAPRVVDRRVDDEAAVRRETTARRGVLDDVGQVFARLEVATQRVALVALVVDAVEQSRSVGRDVESAEREELVTVGLDVAVEQDDLARHVDAGRQDGGVQSSSAASGARQWMPYCLPSTVRP
jgi:hypothetical protein